MQVSNLRSVGVTVRRQVLKISGADENNDSALESWASVVDIRGCAK